MNTNLVVSYALGKRMKYVREKSKKTTDFMRTDSHRRPVVCSILCPPVLSKSLLIE